MNARSEEEVKSVYGDLRLVARLLAIGNGVDKKCDAVAPALDRRHLSDTAQRYPSGVRSVPLARDPRSNSELGWSYQIVGTCTPPRDPARPPGPRGYLGRLPSTFPKACNGAASGNEDVKVASLSALQQWLPRGAELTKVVMALFQSGMKARSATPPLGSLCYCGGPILRVGSTHESS
ncbi:hypothetical protein CYMTET_16427 [Cymbomonas tetramitiformis]|uniref:Uncharacterized protein n=1 Tax=Cymbomonas tetramitiformis TaxID=36881 RepID=A0AAE0L7Y2_9CHLO|nr:hypothetical protein CYMTET_16427 [Cymbomonas tetramitiformis]